jgi:hypothetical protein
MRTVRSQRARARSLGVRSLGVLSLEVLSIGVLSLGVLSLGVLSLGVLSLGVLSLGVIAGCGGRAPAPAAPSSSAPAPRARLVVVAVYDQVGTASLEAQLDHLDPEGAVAWIRARGRYVHRARYGFAATFTAPGHAAIHTGASPRESGIGVNSVYSPTARARVSVLDDGVHGIHGRTGAHASPRALLAPTVADVIRAERPGSIVVALAMKARSTVIPGGQHPDLCLWFDARAGGFTSSTWYGEALPEWLVAWREAHPFGELMSPPWEAGDAAALEARLGPDERSGEGAYGFDATFPHDAAGLEDRDAFLSLPASTDHLIALADEVVDRLALGADDTVDLLAISIGSTDYVGHAFGPGSWEYAESLRRADLALGRLLARLEQRVGPIAVLLTSDHGAAPLIERSREDGHSDASRVDSDTELEVLRAHLAERFGSERAIADGWAQPYVYLTEEARLAPDRELVLGEIRAFLGARPGIGAALDARAIAAASAPPDDEVRALFWRAIPAAPPGDVYVMPSEHSAATEEQEVDRGTSHGSMWAYDREVPVLFAGPGVEPGEQDAPQPQCAVAGTIARLAGVSAPPHACGELD